MDTETLKAVVIAGLESNLAECERAKNNEEVKGNKRLYDSVLSMERDIGDLLKLFKDHDETSNMKGRFKSLRGAGKRKVIETKIARRALGLRNKYKDEMKELNEILGD